jgi:hypothetical protein
MKLRSTLMRLPDQRSKLNLRLNGHYFDLSLNLATFIYEFKVTLSLPLLTKTLRQLSLN